MTYEEFETELRQGAFEGQGWSFPDKETMKGFVDHRTKTIELTELECDIAKSAARRMVEGRRKQYGDFAIGNFVTGIKGEMAVAKQLHKVKKFKDLTNAVNFSRKEFGDGGVDIHWGRWRIDVKTTGIKYGPLVVDSSRPQFHQANLFIIAHLRYDGMEKAEGTRTLKAKKNKVDIYGFMTPEEVFEVNDTNHLVRAQYYDDPQLPTKYSIDCWELRPIRDLMPTTTA